MTPKSMTSAGLWGGEDSGVSNTTTDVIIECASSIPSISLGPARNWALTSDARQRFERGVDPAFLDDGLAIATGWVTEHCGGTPSGVNPRRPTAGRGTPRAVQARTRRRTGRCRVPVSEQVAILERLGFVIEGDQAIVPSWRRDVVGSADLVEEVTRIIGFDKIAAVPLPRADGVARPTVTRGQMIERRTRRAAAARGLDEAITWSFIAEAEAALFGGGAFVLANPISEEMKHMRPSLIPGLAAATRRNLDRGASSVGCSRSVGAILAREKKSTLTLILAG